MSAKMMKGDDLPSFFERTGWSTSIVLRCILLAASILPLHALGFSLYLPSELRILLDFQFNLNLSLQFSLAFAISVFSASYAPAMVIATIALTSHYFIWREYGKRGYKRAKRILFKPADLEGGIVRNIRKPLEFSKFDATLENFIKRKVQERSLIKRYDEARPIITFALSLILLSFFYVGVLRSVVAVAILFLVMVLTMIYDEFKDSYFWIRGNRDLPNSDYSGPINIWEINARGVPSLLGILAILSFVLGGLRTSYLSDSPAFEVHCCGLTTSANLVAPTMEGFIFYNNDNGTFFFERAEKLIQR